MAEGRDPKETKGAPNIIAEWEGEDGIDGSSFLELKDAVGIIRRLEERAYIYLATKEKDEPLNYRLRIIEDNLIDNIAWQMPRDLSPFVRWDMVDGNLMTSLPARFREYNEPMNREAFYLLNAILTWYDRILKEDKEIWFDD